MKRREWKSVHYALVLFFLLPVLLLQQLSLVHRINLLHLLVLLQLELFQEENKGNES
jgi:hypothetical protein